MLWVLFLHEILFPWLWIRICVSICGFWMKTRIEDMMDWCVLSPQFDLMHHSTKICQMLLKWWIDLMGPGMLLTVSGKLNAYGRHPPPSLFPSFSLSPVILHFHFDSMSIFTLLDAFPMESWQIDTSSRQSVPQSALRNMSLVKSNNCSVSENPDAGQLRLFFWQGRCCVLGFLKTGRRWETMETEIDLHG